MNEKSTKEELQALTERVHLLEDHVSRLANSISRIIDAIEALAYTNKGYQDNDPL